MQRLSVIVSFHNNNNDHDNDNDNNSNTLILVTRILTWRDDQMRGSN